MKPSSHTQSDPTCSRESFPPPKGSRPLELNAGEAGEVQKIQGGLMKKLLLTILIMVCLGGCASVQSVKEDITSRVDPISIKDPAQFQRDIDDCTLYAVDQVNKFQKQIFTRALIGAALGAGLGAATGSMYGSRYAGQGAGLGAAYGAVGGAGTARSKADIVAGNCLIHRGYQLLW